MTTNTLHVTVESTADFFEAAREDLRRLESGDDVDDEHVLSLPDESSLEHLLNAKNLELIRTIAREEPASVRELSRLVDRDVKNVSRALGRMESVGLVELEAEGRSKRPTVWYDQVEIDIPIDSVGSGDSDSAPA